MADRSKHKKAAQITGTGSASVDALASRALSMVAQRNSKTTARFDEAVAQQLHDAAAEVGQNRVPDVIKDMLYAGISSEMIADRYIPHVARQMGDEWCEDELSFARVTIGSARLQSALRNLGEHWTSFDMTGDPGSFDDESAAVIVIVVRDSYHTLGAVVLAGQLRRQGISVRLVMGPTPSELQAIFHANTFDAALISANESESLDSLRETVEFIRKSASVSPPIIVGGSVLDQDVDVKARTGADYVTNDPYEALEHCGLINTRRSGAQTTPTRT